MSSCEARDDVYDDDDANDGMMTVNHENWWETKPVKSSSKN